MDKNLIVHKLFSEFVRRQPVFILKKVEIKIVAEIKIKTSSRLYSLPDKGISVKPDIDSILTVLSEVCILLCGQMLL